jgi:hypothetical protein
MVAAIKRNNIRQSDAVVRHLLFLEREIFIFLSLLSGKLHTLS